MERTHIAALRWRLILFTAGAILAAWLLRGVLRALAMQLLAASAEDRAGSILHFSDCIPRKSLV